MKNKKIYWKEIIIVSCMLITFFTILCCVVSAVDIEKPVELTYEEEKAARIEKYRELYRPDIVYHDLPDEIKSDKQTYQELWKFMVWAAETSDLLGNYETGRFDKSLYDFDTIVHETLDMEDKFNEYCNDIVEQIIDMSSDNFTSRKDELMRYKDSSDIRMFGLGYSIRFMVSEYKYYYGEKGRPCNGIASVYGDILELYDNTSDASNNNIFLETMEHEVPEYIGKCKKRYCDWQEKVLEEQSKNKNSYTNYSGGNNKSKSRIDFDPDDYDDPADFADDAADEFGGDWERAYDYWVNW